MPPVASTHASTADDPNYLDVLDEVIGSFDGWRRFDGDQTLHLGWIEAPEDQTPDHELTRYDVGTAYERIAGGEPPREIEMTFDHISHPEQAGDLSGGVERNRGRWSKPYETLIRPVSGADEIYLMSPKDPYVVHARWAGRRGARIEAQRIRNRVTRREGFRVVLVGDDWLYRAIAPGDYVELTHPEAPGGVVTAVVWTIKRLLGSSRIEMTAWGVESE